MTSEFQDTDINWELFPIIPKISLRLIWGTC